MKLTYIKQAGEPNGDAGDQYTGLDRFGRVIDQRWPQGSSELERVDYGFTAASNRQWRQNRVAASGQDEYYSYDGLYQVVELNRGTLNSGKTGIVGTPSWTEEFTYDPIGNWDAYLTKVSGVTDLDQSRTHNTANETVKIDDSSATVSSDLAGNMVKVPQVSDWETTNELTWDAWNRLVEVVNGETTVAQYRYDGKTRRVLKTTDLTRHYFYSDRWQIVEERVDDETTADRQFIWGQRYLDDLVLRDRDVDDDGSLDERLYVLSDYFNPTAIADEHGVVLERYGYNAFGLSRVMAPDFSSRTTSLYDWETRYGAYRYDAETGFYQVRFRYLHPTLGRWLSRDPIEETVFRIANIAQTQLKHSSYIYSYVANNCINLTDKTGLAPNPCSTTDECKCLGCITFAESRGQSAACQKAVADTVKNRAFKKDAAGNWVKYRSYCDVVSERDGGEYNSYKGTNYDNCCKDKCVNKPKGPQDKTERDKSFVYIECDSTNSGNSTAAGTYASDAQYFHDKRIGTPPWIQEAIKEGRGHEVMVPGCTAFRFYHVRPK